MTIRLPRQLLDLVLNVARDDHGWSRSELVRRALVEWFNSHHPELRRDHRCLDK